MVNLLDTSDTFTFTDHSGRPCVALFHDNVKDQEIAEYALTDALPSYLRDQVQKIHKKKYKAKTAKIHGENKNRAAYQRKQSDDILLKEIRGY